jgi:hypothetical protein
VLYNSLILGEICTKNKTYFFTLKKLKPMKKYLFTLILFLLATSIFSQTDLSIKVAIGDSKGSQVELGNWELGSMISYQVSQKFKIGAGLEFDRRSTMSVSSMSFSFTTTGCSLSSACTTYSRYDSKQTTINYIQLPITARIGSTVFVQLGFSIGRATNGQWANYEKQETISGLLLPDYKSSRFKKKEEMHLINFSKDSIRRVNFERRLSIGIDVKHFELTLNYQNSLQNLNKQESPLTIRNHNLNIALVIPVYHLRK